MEDILNYSKQFIESRKYLFRFLFGFFLGNACIYWTVGIQYLIIIFSSKTLFATTYFSFNTALGKILVVLFALASYLGHFSLLALIAIMLTTLPFILICNKKVIIFPIAILAATIASIFLIIDNITFTSYHFHINATLLNIIFSERNGFINFFEFSRHEVCVIVAAAGFIMMLEVALAIFVWKKIVLKNRCAYFNKIGLVLLGCLYCSYAGFLISTSNNNNVLAQQTPNLPLYNNILSMLLPVKNSLALVQRYSESHFSQPLFPVFPLHYPLHPLVFSLSKNPTNILIIGIDAWRFDALNKVLTPHIEKFSRQSLRFMQHYSGGNSTQAGLFSLFYGLPSSYWTSILKQKKGPVFIHELLKRGYQAKVLFSSDMHMPPMDKTAFSEITNRRSFVAMADRSAERDHIITQELKYFIMHRNTEKPFFGFIFYDAVHGYCQAKHIPAVFPVQNPTCERLLIKKQLTAEYRNHYKNSVHFVDNEVAQLLDILKKEKLLHNTIVIITGDHGEEFDDNHQDFWGHGSNYTRYQVQTPLVVYWPGMASKKVHYHTSHYDVVPTLMHHLLHVHNPVQDYSIGADLLSPHPRPYLVVGSYVNMGIIEKDRSMTLMTSGDIQVVDAHAQLLDNKPDAKIITDVLRIMRQYYLTNHQ